MQAGYLDAQLAPVSRFRQGDMAQMKFDIETRILDPVGAVQSPGDPHQPGAKQRLVGETPLESGDHLLEANFAAGSGRRIIDSQRAHVLGGVGLLHVDECGVEDAKLLHVCAVPPCLRARVISV